MQTAHADSPRRGAGCPHCMSRADLLRRPSEPGRRSASAAVDPVIDLATVTWHGATASRGLLKRSRTKRSQPSPQRMPQGHSAHGTFATLPRRPSPTQSPASEDAHDVRYTQFATPLLVATRDRANLCHGHTTGRASHTSQTTAIRRTGQRRLRRLHENAALLSGVTSGSMEFAQRLRRFARGSPRDRRRVRLRCLATDSLRCRRPRRGTRQSRCAGRRAPRKSRG